MAVNGSTLLLEAVPLKCWRIESGSGDLEVKDPDDAPMENNNIPHDKMATSISGNLLAAFLEVVLSQVCLR